jgi:hypothetical protein
LVVDQQQRVIVAGQQCIVGSHDEVLSGAR